MDFFLDIVPSHRDSRNQDTGHFLADSSESDSKMALPQRMKAIFSSPAMEVEGQPEPWSSETVR